MADQTRMVYPEMERAAANIDKNKTQIDETIQSMEQTVSSLCEGWVGEGYQALVRAWQESKPTMLKLSEAIGAYAPKLRDAAEKQKELELIIAQSMGNAGL